MSQDLYRDILGIPPPPEESLETYIDLIQKTFRGITKHLDFPDHFPDLESDQIIYLSLSFYSPDDWKRRFIHARKQATKFAHTSLTYWKIISIYFCTPEFLKAYKKFNPSFDPEKYFEHIRIEPAAKKIVPETLPKKSPKQTPNPNETIRQFITRCAPSINYLQVFNFMSDHTKNRYSARGRKVYPYGQEYLARELDITTRTVRRIFSWLQRQHIIFKRSPHRYFKPGTSTWKNKTATWFVCSSWRQSVWALDPKGQRPKQRPLRSPRKRHRRTVHTKPSPLKR